MLVFGRVPLLWLGLTLGLASCSRTATDATVSPQPAPAAEPEAEPEDDFPFAKNTFVSTSRNEEAQEEQADEASEAEAGLQAEFAVTTPTAVKEVAEAAVAEQLDQSKTWKTSPVLPASWPAKEHEVVVFFYPLSSNAGSLTEHQAFSAAFRVTVSLSDGTTEVTPITKRRKLGMVKETRPSSLERRELEMAETALVKQLMGVDPNAGAKPYWGYLKYVHEHPKVGKDLERRSSSFYKWLRRKHGR